MTERLQISLHPLPILNICDHHTRVSLQKDDKDVRVVGGLLGTQQGREIEIMNTFEIVIESAAMSEGDDEWKVDHGYFVTRKDQFRQVFPTFDFLGWYSIGDAPTPSDISLHKQVRPIASTPSTSPSSYLLSLSPLPQFFEYNETPLFLQLSSPLKKTIQGKELPIKIFESIVEIKDDKPEVGFGPVGFEIETGEAERVAVDHVSKPGGMEDSNSSGLIQSLTTQRNALKMLSDRVTLILLYLEKVKEGKVERDHETIRMINSLVASLPKSQGQVSGETSTGEELKEEFMTEYNDVLLTTYLSTLTKELSSTNSLLDKQLLFVQPSATDSSGGGGGGRHDERRGGGRGFGGKRGGLGKSDFFGRGDLFS